MSLHVWKAKHRSASLQMQAGSPAVQSERLCGPLEIIVSECMRRGDNDETALVPGGCFKRKEPGSLAPSATSQRLCQLPGVEEHRGNAGIGDLGAGHLPV